MDVSTELIENSLKVRDGLRRVFASVSATEGTLWLFDKDGDALVPAWNSGPNAEAIVGKYRQPLASGLISLACVTEQALCENGVYLNTQQDPALDQRLRVLTCAMIAVPLRLHGETCGVVSCVKLKMVTEDPDPPPFSVEDLALVSEAVENLQAEVNEG